MFHDVRAALARPRRSRSAGQVEDAHPRSRRPALTRGRIAAVALTLVGLWSLVAVSPALFVAARQDQPKGLDQFMWGLAVEESGRDYYARNQSSGAYGKYQIMPENWAGWAARFLHQRQVDQNPLNQELVARAKVAALHDWLGTWRLVAHWWLTGDSQRDEGLWSAYSRHYVDNVMSLKGRAPAAGDPLPEQAVSSDGFTVQRGDRRVILRDATLVSRPGRVHTWVRDVGQGLVLPVRRVEWGPLHHVIWLRLETANGTTGWIQMGHTAPARPFRSNAQ